ncbi:hypothetical protein [Nocardioides sp. B-3]|uniref:hypothetical protein n=1 Tax=Nocardioides sp. B-3 TaxID=2895565 RepID=UPI0021522385|nr:hypothetical protein [Nocardioides sp. B-3]UUZ61953.1 hypothetical protein LP418_13190 [Nocardioides sp. B-3]
MIAALTVVIECPPRVLATLPPGTLSSCLNISYAFPERKFAAAVGGTIGALMVSSPDLATLVDRSPPGHRRRLRPGDPGR